MPHPDAKLFQPIRVGNLKLSHRMVLAPLVRFRADDAHVPTDIMVDYYAQRASLPRSLLIVEANLPAANTGGYDDIPGIWSDAQVDAWKKVADAVHAQGSYIFMQICCVGRVGDPKILARPDSPRNPGGPYPYVSSSDIPLPDRQDGPRPRPLTHEEILEYIELFGQAAHNAVHRAGFDGVEVHGAHGYLIDQFTQDTCNKRTDQWGGSLENRTRFALEVIRKVVDVVGEERTALRLSPFNAIQCELMEHPQPTYAYLVSRVRESYPRFAYLHVVEPRVSVIWECPESEEKGSVFLSAGGYTVENAMEAAEEKGDLIIFGRYYISNPDLPTRIKNGIPLKPYDRSTFYDVGKPEGYDDYPFADKETEARYKTWKEGHPKVERFLDER